MVFASRFQPHLSLSASASLRGPFRARRRGRRSFLSCVTLALMASGALLSTACGVATFIVQQYEGEPLASERIAVLRLNGDASVRLEELDGEILAYELNDRGSRVHIEMLPGEHEIGLADGSGLPIKRRRFVAEAGRVYRPMVFRPPSPAPETAWLVAIYEVERDSDTIVREISQVASTPASAGQRPGDTSGGPESGSEATVRSSPSATAPVRGTSSSTPPGATPSGPDTSTPPSPTEPAPAPDRDVTPTGLPNTTANTQASDQTPALAPSPVPPGVSPAKGPPVNPPPPEASPQ